MEIQHPFTIRTLKKQEKRGTSQFDKEQLQKTNQKKTKLELTLDFMKKD